MNCNIDHAIKAYQGKVDIQTAEDVNLETVRFAECRQRQDKEQDLDCLDLLSRRCLDAKTWREIQTQTQTLFTIYLTVYNHFFLDQWGGVGFLIYIYGLRPAD